MRKVSMPARPIKTSDLSFIEFYDEISDHWEEKAKALQLRRWRALRHAIKGYSH